MDAFNEMQRIIYDDAVLIVNYERGQAYVSDPRVKGIVRRAVGAEQDYTYAYIDLDG